MWRKLSTPRRTIQESTGHRDKYLTLGASRTSVQRIITTARINSYKRKTMGKKLYDKYSTKDIENFCSWTRTLLLRLLSIARMIECTAEGRNMFLLSDIIMKIYGLQRK